MMDTIEAPFTARGIIDVMPEYAQAIRAGRYALEVPCEGYLRVIVFSPGSTSSRRVVEKRTFYLA